MANASAHKRCPRFSGVFTALVTPFHADTSIDWQALDRLVDRQLDAGVSGLVALGTTAEAATLAAAEKDAIVSRLVDRVAGKVPIIVGVGSNETLATVTSHKRAQKLGAAASMVVTPYYNKPTQAGLLAHYRHIADACDLPLIIYNVPSRTGCDLDTHTALTLSQHANIVGLKDATGDLLRLDALIEQCPPDFSVLSGDDLSTCAFCLMGGDGVISVASNLIAKAMVNMVGHARSDKANSASRMHRQWVALIKALFMQSNPLPIKAAMHHIGWLEDAFRLPLTSMDPGPKEQLLTTLASFDKHIATLL